MPDNSQFEIPAAMRDAAEKNVEQAHTAAAQFMDATRKAQDMVARSSEVMTSSAREIQDRMMKYTASNMDANFKFARDLARVRDLNEALELQQDFARRQMETYAKQAQDLTRLMAEAAQKAQTKT